MSAVTTATFAKPTHRKSFFGRELDTAVVLDSSNADSGNTPTTWFRSGNVIGKRTSTGRYIEINDGNVDVPTAAAKSTSSHTDANGTIEIVCHRGTISVGTSTGAGSEANNATDLNADAAFKAHFIATSGGGELTITSRELGSHVWFYISTNTTTNGWTEGSGGTVFGTDPEIFITEEMVSLVDDLGTAQHAMCNVSYIGHYDESELVVGGTKGATLPGWAKQLFIRRGCRFI